MKKALLVISACTLFINASAQEVFSSRYFLRADTVTVDKYEFERPDSSKYEYAVLPLYFGGEKVKSNKKLFEKLSNARIKKVELIYTDYPEDMDMYYLNEKRLQYLYFKCNGIFSNSITKWSMVKQTACSSKEEAQKMFHGFVIEYLPGATSASHSYGLSKLMSVVKGESELRDSAVIEVFDRNKWNHGAVVADFTGSMSPYITQVLVWYKLHHLSCDINEFTFFNDGDRKPGYKKRIGSTGGIYYVQTDYEDSVLNTAAQCVAGGYGGEVEENDVEALLVAQKRNPHLKQIILIADNWAPVRDMRLLSMVKVPVRVVVCGQSKGTRLNLDLINIAFQTKGSLHTIEEDLEELSKKHTGAKFSIGGEQFYVQYGRIKRVSP